MIIDLVDTTAAQINSALLDARRRAGSPAMGMVLTLVIATDERDHYDALRAATSAAREHPSRILVAVGRPGREPARLDAEVRVGGESGPGEVVLLRMYGPLADNADSVALPLLLPDAPVVTWWAGRPPDVPAQDPLGALAQRRITDAGACPDPMAELGARARGYTPGDTDLAWTRLTSWRTLLASALDEPYDPIRGARIAAEPANPSAELLALWLGWRLDVPVERVESEGPGITEVVLDTEGGDISVARPDGRLAALQRPGQPERSVALARRSTAELIAEELRRLDPDEVYGATLHLFATGAGRRAGAAAAKGKAVAGGAAKAAAGTAAKAAAGTAAKAPAAAGTAAKVAKRAAGAAAKAAAKPSAGKADAGRSSAGRSSAGRSSAAKAADGKAAGTAKRAAAATPPTGPAAPSDGTAARGARRGTAKRS